MPPGGKNKTQHHSSKEIPTALKFHFKISTWKYLLGNKYLEISIYNIWQMNYK